MNEPAAKPARKKSDPVSKAPGEAAQNGMRAQGLRTRNVIVDIAKKLLLEGGILEFSLREVAIRAGISTSNVQYYFSTRLVLLRAVVEPVIDAYLDDLRRACDSNVPPELTLKALTERALREAKDPEASALWWHFVSFALVDAECSRLLDDWYEALTRGLAQIIRGAYPDCSMADSLHRATLLIAMVDGLNFQLGAGRRKRAYTRGIEAKYLAAANGLLRGELPVEPED